MVRLPVQMISIHTMHNMIHMISSSALLLLVIPLIEICADESATNHQHHRIVLSVNQSS